MKKISRLSVFTSIFLTLVLVICTGCTKKEELPDGSSVETVKDKDGNVYQTVKIGTQVWMVENLKTTKYNDGTAIPLATDNTTWLNSNTCYCWYNNDATTYKNTYGALYSWGTVNTGKLAPTGWHVPTDAEWSMLVNFVSANLGTSGYRDYSTGNFGGIGVNGRWWSSTEGNSSGAWYRSINSTSSNLERGIDSKSFGYSIRCVRD